VEALNEKLLFHLILNAYWEPLEFELPPADDRSEYGWRRWIDTSLDSPHDIVEWEAAPPVSGRTYPAGPRSVVVLFARLADEADPSS
jgi:isoamylase